MGSLLEFRRPDRVPPRTVFGLSTRLVERDSSSGQRAIVEIDGLAIFCVVADVPVVGDVIYGDVTAIVEKVRVTRHGRVTLRARRVAPEAQGEVLFGGMESDSEECQSPRVDAILGEMRRRRQLCGPRR